MAKKSETLEEGVATPAAASTPASAKITVSMEDGSTADFTPKQKVIKTSTIDEVNGLISVRMDFRNGAVRHFTMPTDMILRFAAHGAEQKLGDAMAGEDSIEDGVEAVTDLIARLGNGEWNAKRAKGEFAGQSDLMRALVEATGKTLEESRAWLATKSAAEKIALRGSSKLAPIVQRLAAEKAARAKTPKISGDDLLSDFA